MPLDPTVEIMLQQMAEAGGPTLTEMSPPDAREMYRNLQATSPKPDVSSVTNMDADGVPVRVYKVNEAPGQPSVVFFHGGGWVIGDLETHDGVCRQLANAANCTIIAVDYRLAPENPYPASIDDCFTATQWVAGHAAELGINADRMAVAGDSAGGNLAACVSLKARDNAGPAICYQLLIYPVTDATMSGASYKENEEGYMLTRASMEWFWAAYTAGNHQNDPYASPLAAKNLSNLPPACVITAEFDPLRDEGEHYADALIASSVAVDVQRFDGMIHGFFGMTDILEGARQAMQLASTKLRESFQ